jgi:putative Ca2+/H+ antiporter (TMEM165/GDT1 family)
MHDHPHSSPTGAMDRSSLNRLALSATLHCLAGCSIGEILGMVIGTALNWSNLLTVTISIILAFVFGYALTIRPLRRAGIPLPRAVRLALASDTVSITIMEIVDTSIMLAVPGAMSAHVDESVFWISLAAALATAGVAAYPANRWLISRGRGHAIVHEIHRS